MSVLGCPLVVGGWYSAQPSPAGHQYCLALHSAPLCSPGLCRKGEGGGNKTKKKVEPTGPERMSSRLAQREATRLRALGTVVFGAVLSPGNTVATAVSPQQQSVHCVGGT